VVQSRRTAADPVHRGIHAAFSTAPRGTHTGRAFSDVHTDAPVLGRCLARNAYLGRIRSRNEIFSIFDLGVFTTIGYGDRPAAISAPECSPSVIS